jgi:hypothetical protein
MRELQARNLLYSGEVAKLVIDSPLNAARRAYIHGSVDVEEFERRVERALWGERKTEWLDET